MSDNMLISLSKQFAVDTVNLCSKINGKNILVNQLLRSGTSIGANIHEGNYASSRADFINKFQIALKECYETEYWLELIQKSEIFTDDLVKTLLHDCGAIRRMLISSINTTKTNMDN